jgi:hypothetical protein
MGRSIVEVPLPVQWEPPTVEENYSKVPDPPSPRLQGARGGVVYTDL